MTAHTAAGKLQGFAADAPWYEAAFVAGITNALNVAADGLAPPGSGPLLEPVEEERAGAALREVFAEIRDFHTCPDVPLVFRMLGREPGYLAELWAAWREAFTDNALPRRLKASLAFAVSLTTRSGFGTAFHLDEMRRLGVGEPGVLEIIATWGCEAPSARTDFARASANAARASASRPSMCREFPSALIATGSSG